MDDPTVLYITGEGRSGSTVLGTLLAVRAGGFFGSELYRLWEFLERGKPCTCGSPVPECPFWSAVFVEAGLPATQAFGREVRTALASSARLRHLFTGGGFEDPLVDSTGRHLGGTLAALYSAIASISGSRTVVDSSKSPSYGALISRALPESVHVVQLVRDSRAVSYSWTRKVLRVPGNPEQGHMRRYSIVKASWRWNLINSAAERLGKQSRTYRLLRYEAFCERPYEIADQLLVDAGGAASGAITRCTIGHSIGGNPARFNEGTAKINVDVAWKSTFRLGERIVVSLLTAPMLFRYGYFSGRQ